MADLARAREITANFDKLMVLEPEPNAEVFMLTDTRFPKGMKNVKINWFDWNVKSDGNISLVFPTHKFGGAKVLNYSPRQLPDLIHILGAILSFYQTPVTIDDAQDAYLAYEGLGQKNTEEYRKAYNFAEKSGPALKYIELMGFALYFEGLEFAKLKPGADPLIEYPPDLPQGEYNVIMMD